MNLLEATAAAALRAVLIACVVGAISLWLVSRLRGSSSKSMSWLFAAGALAYFTPSMLAGYGWLPAIARWPAGSLAREIFYAAALVIRFVPVGVLSVRLAGSGPNPTAMHAWKLAGGGGWRFRLREAGATLWLSGGLVFLLAFQEFDLATSWGIRSWTVSLFDAQIGGLPVTESLRLASIPLALEIVVILCLWRAARGRREGAIQQRTNRTRAAGATALTSIGVTLAFFLLIPAVTVLQLGSGGFRAWLETPSMLREIFHACMSGGIAAILAWAFSSARPAWVRALLVIPGLAGSLIIGLAILGALQWMPAAGSTVWPWLAGLTLYLLPVAVLLRLALSAGTQRAAFHVARLAGARRLQWELWRGRALAAGLLLFGVGYADFTIGTLLAPPQFPTIFPRVFNLMHYGQSAVLSFAVFLAVVTPLLIAGGLLLLTRTYARRSR